MFIVKTDVRYADEIVPETEQFVCLLFFLSVCLYFSTSVWWIKDIQSTRTHSVQRSRVWHRGVIWEEHRRCSSSHLWIATPDRRRLIATCLPRSVHVSGVPREGRFKGFKAPCWISEFFECVFVQNAVQALLLVSLNQKFCTGKR